MAIRDRKTGEITHEGRVYRVRGTFNCDSHVDLVTVINDDGSDSIIELRNPDTRFATVDATEEMISLREKYKEFQRRVNKRRDLRDLVELASETILTTRQFIELCSALKENPNWRDEDLTFHVHDLCTNEKLTKFQSSLARQCIAWAITKPEHREYDQPLSFKQLSYLGKDFTW